jgi:hypothetical protein
MKFEPITIRDLDKIKLLQPADWNDIIPKIEFYIRSPFCFPVKAIVDNHIAGIGAAILYDTTAWLAPIMDGKLPICPKLDCIAFILVFISRYLSMASFWMVSGAGSSLHEIRAMLKTMNRPSNTGFREAACLWFVLVDDGFV